MDLENRAALDKQADECGARHFYTNGVILSGCEKSLYINALCSWRPPADDLSAAPKLEWTEPNFRRRLSQLTKMTVQVVHDLLAECGAGLAGKKEPPVILSGSEKSAGAEALDKQAASTGAISDAADKNAAALKNTKLVFASMRGELEREFKINKTLIQDGEILPAPFSLSTFNAAIAQATIALGLKGGYSAVYPSHAPAATAAAFRECILAAAAPILCGEETEIIFVYADENIPDYYKAAFFPNDSRGKTESEKDGGVQRQQDVQNNPLAFAALLSSQKAADSVELNLKNLPENPEDFLKL